MNYCPNCGEKCTEGSIFCVKCGNMLQKNVLQEQKESCNTNVKEKNTYIEVNTGYILESLKTYWNIIISPGKEVKRFIEEGKKQTSYILLFISLFFQSFLYLWKVNQIYDGLFNYSKNIIINLVSGIGRFLGHATYELDLSELMDIQEQLTLIKGYFPIDNLMIFFQGVLLSLVVIVIMSMGVYIINKRNNITTILKIIGIATIPVVCGGFFSILIAYLNESIGFAVFILFILISIGSLYTNISKYLLNGKSVVLELSLIITVLIIILYILAGNCFSKVLPGFINKFMEFLDTYGYSF